MKVYITKEDQRYLELRHLLKLNGYTITENIETADFIILGTSDELRDKNIKENAFVVSYHRLLDNQNYCLSESEDYLLKNAELTSLGTIETFCLNNQNITIFGNGRIAMSLKKHLKTQPTIICRHPKDDEKDWYDESYKCADVIINTVPSKLPVDLSQLKKEILIIDLASAPYGFSREEINRYKLNYHLFSKVPAVCFPKRAALLIYKEVMRCLPIKR